jgi:2-oxoglutarate ferredoxin oxidoreductase subunit alpha
MDRLARKFETARQKVPGPVIHESDNRELGVIAYGTSHWAVAESLDQLKHEHDLEASYCRLRAFPFSPEVFEFIRRHRRVYVIDQNRDAQMLSLLRLEVDASDVKRLRSIRHYNGLPIDARTITDAIVCQEAEN